MTAGRVVHIADDGSETDVTEGVQALYDLVINSMNWGSGFWDYEDALPVATIGRLCGFEQIEEVERYVRARKHEHEASHWRLEHQPPPTLGAIFTGIPNLDGLTGAQKPPEHDHVWSSVGRCMWPACRAEQV